MRTELLIRRAALACLAAWLGAASVARAGIVYGITYTSPTEPNTLVRFDSATPGAVTTIGPLLSGGKTVQPAFAIDFRPATGRLYLGAGAADGSGGQLYTVNVRTAALTPVGASFDPSLLGIGIPSFAFDPARDQLRTLATPNAAPPTATNTRFNPANNVLISKDANLAFAAGDENASLNPLVVIGAAYGNDGGGGGGSSPTLYGYEIQSDHFVTIGGPAGSPSADGGQLHSIGPSGLVVPGTADAFGFDISDAGEALVSSFTEQLPGVHLFNVNLATGAATDAGAIGTPAGTVVIDIAAAPGAGAVPLPPAAALFPAAAAVAGWSVWRTGRRMRRV